MLVLLLIARSYEKWYKHKTRNTKAKSDFFIAHHQLQRSGKIEQRELALKYTEAIIF